MGHHGQGQQYRILKSTSDRGNKISPPREQPILRFLIMPLRTRTLMTLAENRTTEDTRATEDTKH